MAIVITAVFSVSGYGAETHDKARVAETGNAPEIGAVLASGPVLLNVAGAGYKPGDIVRISTEVAEIGRGSVILFDWRKATGRPGGFGPGHMIGEVIGLPGDELNVYVLLNYRGRDGAERNAVFSTFEKRGVRNYDGNLILSFGDYLVETDKNIIIVDHSSVNARVEELLGHDSDAGQKIKQRVY